MMIPCSICDELRAESDNRLSSALPGMNIWNAVLATTPSYALIPSVGPLVAGHSLIVTRAHSSNILAGSSVQQRDEIRILIGALENSLSDGRGPKPRLLCFEHGCNDASVNDVLCSTIHGHLHLVPLDEGTADLAVSDILGKKTRKIDIDRDGKILMRMKSYLTVFLWNKTSDSWCLYVRDGRGLPSQYARRVIAERLGLSSWDWKKNPGPKLLRRTIAELGFRPNMMVLNENQR